MTVCSSALPRHPELSVPVSTQHPVLGAGAEQSLTPGDQLSGAQSLLNAVTTHSASVRFDTQVPEAHPSLSAQEPRAGVGVGVVAATQLSWLSPHDCPEPQTPTVQSGSHCSIAAQIV